MQQEFKIRNPLATFLKYSCLIVCIVIVNVVLMYGINCADSDNCLRPWCESFKLTSEYTSFIAANCART
jgi:hypothetical protein